MNLPNKLTILRIFLTILIIFFCIFPFYSVGIHFSKLNISGLVVEVRYLIAGFIYLIAAITDYCDGYIARGKNMVTNTGKLLDAIADKVLVNSVLIIFAHQRFLPVIVPVVCIFRDEIVNAIKMEALRRGYVMAAIRSGKIKTAAMMIGLFLMFFYNLPFELVNLKVADFLIYFATVMSLVSGVEYYRLFKKIKIND